jgi:DNA-binding NtrC family response regulator
MKRAVVIVDDDPDLRSAIEDVIGLWPDHRCLALKDHEDLLKHGEEVMSADLVILDVNLGPDVPSGIDAYRWLREQGYRGRIVFLTGHARSHPSVAEALRIGDARVFEKPIQLETLQRIVAGD